MFIFQTGKRAGKYGLNLTYHPEPVDYVKDMVLELDSKPADLEKDASAEKTTNQPESADIQMVKVTEVTESKVRLQKLSDGM